MLELAQLELREHRIRKTCLGGTIVRAEVSDDAALRGATPQELQDSLANSRIVDVRHKGMNLVLVSDKDQTLVLTMQHDADIECHGAPAVLHPTDARVILHFDDDHTLDFRLPSVRDHLLFFRTADLDAIPMLRDIGPEALTISFQEFRERLRAHAGSTIHSFLADPMNVSGLSPADIDEICFQARIRPDKRINQLLGSEVETIYDQMQKILGRIAQAHGNLSQLESFGYLMPRRGTDRGCPRDGSGLQVIHFGSERSYYCPRCQEESPLDPKRHCFW